MPVVTVESIVRLDLGILHAVCAVRVDEVTINFIRIIQEPNKHIKVLFPYREDRMSRTGLSPVVEFPHHIEKSICTSVIRSWKLKRKDSAGSI
jgi:hypothetical protein